MNINKYNTRVRQAISEEFVKCSKRKQECLMNLSVVLRRLASEKDTLLYSEYMRLEKEKDCLMKELQAEEIRLEVWDMARELCLNIADEA